MPYVAPKDIRKYQIIIGSVDITGLVPHLEIFQNISETVWSAKLHVLDTQNIIKNLELMERYTTAIIKLDTQANKPCNGEFKFNFIIDSVTDRRIDHEQQYSYTLNLVSEPLILNSTSRVTAGYKGLSAADIVRDIVKKSFNYELSETSAINSPSMSLIGTNKKPFDAIHEILSKISSSGGADFEFFQISDKGFALLSHNDMLTRRKSGITLVQKNFGDRTESPNREDENAFVNIERHEIIRTNDKTVDSDNGAYSQRIVAHNILDKTIQTHDFKNDLMTNIKHGNIPSKIHYLSTSTDTLDFNNNFKNWANSRTFKKNQFDYNSILVDISGHACLSEYLGKSFKINLPSHDNTNEYDGFYKDEYILKGIKHIISGGQYNLHLKLSKVTK